MSIIGSDFAYDNGMETERKYLQPDFALVRQRLRALGAESLGSHFESNLILDSPDRRLLRDDCLLRVRSRIWPDQASHLLTFKYPPAQSPARVKAREELELAVESAAMLVSIMRFLGYEPAARYEKVRESWHLAWEGCACEVDLDLLPFMEAVEVEAPPGLQDGLARALGLDNCQISLKSYNNLHQAWRESCGLPPENDIIFAEEQKRNIPIFASLAAKRA